MYRGGTVSRLHLQGVKGEGVVRSGCRAEVDGREERRAVHACGSTVTLACLQVRCDAGIYMLHTSHAAQLMFKTSCTDLISALVSSQYKRPACVQSHSRPTCHCAIPWLDLLWQQDRTCCISLKASCTSRARPTQPAGAFSKIGSSPPQT